MVGTVVEMEMSKTGPASTLLLLLVQQYGGVGTRAEGCYDMLRYAAICCDTSLFVGM